MEECNRLNVQINSIHFLLSVGPFSRIFIEYVVLYYHICLTFRYQGMYPLQGWNYPCGPGSGPGPATGGANEDTSTERPAIVKDKDLEDFDRLAISDDGWAKSTVDVDYSERLVFSDEEDVIPTDKRFKVLLTIE
jgi:hypothetical protein